MKRLHWLLFALLLVPTVSVAAPRQICGTGVDCAVEETFTVQKALNVGSDLKSFTTRGAAVTLKTAQALVSPLTGATTSATNLIPAGSFVLGCTVRVTTTITGATTFTIGDGTDVDKWGTGILLPAGTTTSGSAFTASPSSYATATSVVLTATGSNFTAGAVRVTCHYWTFTPASN